MTCPAPIVHTAPALSTICVAVVGTVVPSGEAPPPVLPPPGVVGPTLSHPFPVHCHQLASVPNTYTLAFFQRIRLPYPLAACTPFRRMTCPAPMVHTAPSLSTICGAEGTVVPSNETGVPPGILTRNASRRFPPRFVVQMK